MLPLPPPTSALFPYTTLFRSGAMEYLEDAKRRGVIRAHGVSCHTLSALQLAAQTPWVEVDLARINPSGILMDAEDRKSTRLNSSHLVISYAVFCLIKKNHHHI